jgi:hypothetical protein
MSDNVFQFNSSSSYPSAVLEGDTLETLGRLMTSDFGVVKPVDACICFGNPEYYDVIARTAANLYHDGNFPLVIVSGRTSVFNGVVSEASVMQDILLAEDVPEEAILVEDRSTNTKENIVCTREILDYEGLDVSSVLGVGRKSSSFRFVSTFAHNWEDTDFVFRGAPDFENVTYDNWMYHSEAALYIWREVEKIVEYSEKGDVCPQFAKVVTDFCDRLKQSNIEDRKIEKIVQGLNF